MHPAGCGCKEEHELGTTSTCLRGHINLEAVRVFNSDCRPEEGNLVFKPYEKRLSGALLTSDPSSDNELLFTIPFHNPCDIAHLLLVNEGDEVVSLKLYANRPHFDFSDIEVVTPTQELQIPPDLHGSFLHKLSILKFRDLSDLAIHISGDSVLKIRYIGIRGKSRRRQADVVDAKYEVVPTASFQESLAEVKHLKYSGDTIGHRQAPARGEWSTLYSKNRHADRVRRGRRQHHFFVKRQEQDKMREMYALDQSIAMQRTMLGNIFGKPLSQEMGDGGLFPYLQIAHDRVAYLRGYFGSQTKKGNVDNDEYATLARSPYRTRGAFKGKAPLADRPFYRIPQLEEEDAAYNKAAEYRQGMPPIIPDLDKHDREHRFYNGLLTEVLFHRLPKELIKEMSAMEIDAKQGRIDPNKLRRKKEKKSGSGSTGGVNLSDISFNPPQ
ncbi:PITH domain-containing protein C [Babesia ovis]|uniref:PITH domain-containing protein C n=1 Tax=Babesia ovis TaxID=5869 RepID=A0A9W5T8F2_BABOV|nr:PITH domain-containing protein C [Babesia ovis]